MTKQIIVWSIFGIVACSAQGLKHDAKGEQPADKRQEMLQKQLKSKTATPQGKPFKGKVEFAPSYPRGTIATH